MPNAAGVALGLSLPGFAPASVENVDAVVVNRIGLSSSRSLLGYAERVEEGDNTIATVLPHADFGDPECCGCLNGIIGGDMAKIVLQ